jgi:ArsR family transcriptional regulator
MNFLNAKTILHLYMDIRIFAIVNILSHPKMNQTDFFKCLSDTTRLDILKLVMVKQNVCVCELTEQLQLSQPKISRHLALLRNLSILLDQRQGQWVYYRLNPNLPEWANEVLDIISKQNDDVIENPHVNASISIHCE